MPAPAPAVPMHCSTRSAPSTRKASSSAFSSLTVLNGMDVQFDLVISSHLKRSLQTASFVGTEMGYESSRFLQSKALAPSASFADFHNLIQQHAKSESVLVVGHNPNISAFLGAMLVPHEARPAQVRLRKGSIARLNLQRGSATLQWLLDPRTVRALYATSTKSSRRKTSRK